MGLQVIEGWDLYPTGNIGALVGALWNNSNTTQKTIRAVNPRNGRANAATTNGTSGIVVRPITMGLADDCYFGFAARHDNYTNRTTTSAAANVTSFGIGAASAGLTKANPRLQVGLSGASGEYSLSFNGTTLVTSGPLAINAYHYHVVYFDNATGAYSYWIDQTLIGSGNVGSSGHAIAELQFGAMCGNGTTDLDDVFFWTNPSASEAANIESVLDFAVLYAMPDANGATQQWTSSSGTAFQDIDEQPYSTADFIEAANVGDVSTFDLADISTGVFQVFGVHVQSYERKETAGGGSVNQRITANGVNGTGTTNALTTTETMYVDSSNSNVNPDTGVAWVPADLASLGLRYERTA